MFSNRYIFRYASILVILVAILLSGAAILLQPAQDKNVKVEKIQDILKSANIPSTPENAMELYGKYIISEVVIDSKGEEVAVYSNGKFVKGDKRAFDINLKSELKIQQELALGKSTVQPFFPLYVCLKDQDTIYIIPLSGTGLWGPLWGNIALKKDFKTVEGVTFGHKSETPGLGAEIAALPFQTQFAGKQIFDDKGDFTSIKVIKGGVANSNINPVHGVDAISGGTITSKGVSAMLESNLSNYITYIKNRRQ